MKKPLDLFASILGLIINNSLYLYGIYILAYLSNQELFLESSHYFATTAMVLISWGFLSVFMGGLIELGGLIESGEFESCLAMPRAPLFIAAISKSNIISAGEIIQGLITVFFLAHTGEYILALNTLLCSFCMCLSFGAILILLGTLSFFSSKGSQFSKVMIQTVLTISLFPISRALQGKEKLLLYFSPAVLTVTMPSYILQTNNPWVTLLLALGSSILLLISIKAFQRGLFFYKTKSYFYIKE